MILIFLNKAFNFIKVHFDRNEFFVFRASRSILFPEETFFVVRPNLKKFLFNFTIKGIEDFGPTKIVFFHPCEKTVLKNIIKKKCYQYYINGSEAFAFMPTFFYLIPEFSSHYDKFSYFQKVPCHKNSFFFFKKINIDFFKDILSLQVPFDLPDKFFFGDLLLEKCFINLVDHKKEFYEIFFQEFFFFGPFELFKKSLFLKVQYSINVKMFKDNILI